MLRWTCAALLAAITGFGAPLADIDAILKNPPADAKPMVRWWWFGPAVAMDELGRELQQMKDAGFGGFEVQPVYPLALESPKYLSDEFLRALRFTAERAYNLGLRFDLTLGSGWPFGGPHIPITQAAGRLRVEPFQGATPPPAGEGEAFLAVVPGPDGRQLAFFSSRTRMKVKRPAYGAEGYVLDHLSATAVDAHLNAVGEPLLKAVAEHKPYAVFSDSLEVYNQDWTTNFLAEFQKRRGYDLSTYLPALIADIGEKTAGVRYDWGRTLIELVNERYLTRVTEWAHAHGTKFRSQTYGIPPVTLSSSSRVDLIEGEGMRWRNFSTTRWATSAAHLYSRPVVSSEAFTWLHSPSFRATPLDYKAEADIHFLQGVNQLVGHGWPYSPESAGEPGYRFYAAAVLNAHNPWWFAMPDLARYLQRVSALLRQGEPANDVAIYLPVADALSSFTAGKTSVDKAMDQLVGTEVIPQVLDAGYNFDFVDDEALARVNIPHKILILPGVDRMPLETAQKLEAFAKRGGVVIATRHPPMAAPGMVEGPRDTPRIAELMRAIQVRTVVDEKTLGSELRQVLAPDVAGKPAAIGFIHRRIAGADVYFLANTSNRPVRAELRFRSQYKQEHWRNPVTNTTAASGGYVFHPYESQIVIVSNDAADPAPVARPAQATEIGTGWQLTLAGAPVQMTRLISWTENPQTRFYSGTATYEKTLTLPERPNGPVYLSFGEGTPVPETPRVNGMRAWLDAPVRDAAAVYVNDKLVGTVWCAPFETDISPALTSGQNRLRVVVGNTAINRMAGEPRPDYKELYAKYGERFTPQDMDNLQPLPSGLLGPIRLLTPSTAAPAHSR